MATRVTEISPGIISLEKEGSTFTGIDTRIPTNSFSLRKLAGQKRQVGLIVNDREITEWRATSFAEHDGSI